MRPEVVFFIVIFYLVSKRPLKAVRNAVSFNPKSDEFKLFIAAHNLALAAFSAVCAYNSWPIVMQHLFHRGIFDTFCDVDGSLWGAQGLGAWITIFYVSKYYEFLDTWILILKGKEASFLQIYHHTGIVLSMWGGVLSQSAWLLVLLLLNSVIHTMMYTYFFIKTVRPKTEIKVARYLTLAQIAQFITGIASSIGVLVKGEACDSQSSRFTLALAETYVCGLIILFTSFARNKYKEKES